MEDEEATVSEEQCDLEKDWKMRRPLLVKNSEGGVSGRRFWLVLRHSLVQH